jgi:hypothetical protein
MASDLHTPGPWIVGDLNADLPGYDIYEPGGCRIAEVDAELVGHDRAVADARLIAAAPELLQALRDALDHIAICFGKGNRIYQAGVAALAKAQN